MLSNSGPIRFIACCCWLIFFCQVLDVAFGQDIIFEATLNNNAEQFTYQDDAFGTTTGEDYASGTYLPNGGFDGDGGLQVILGGIDDDDIFGMSGGWRRDFTLSEEGLVSVSFRYLLSMTSEYESDEFSEVLVGLDGISVTSVTQLFGDGNGGPTQSTGWISAQVELGTVEAGAHYLTLGVFNNKKTLSDESTELGLDDVTMTNTITNPDPWAIVTANFDSSSDGFTYSDDTFRNTNNPAYATGTRLGTGGFSGGALEVELGGLDDAVIFGMSGGWERTFSLDAPTALTLSFRYQLIQASDYEADELSQALASIDGTSLGQPPFDDILVEIVGNGNGGGEQTTGWSLFRADLGTLGVGGHSLILGGYSNKKTLSNELTRVLFDDVLLFLTDGAVNPPAPPPKDPTTSGPQQIVDRLDLQQFKDNIFMLASFGDRTQGSASYNAAAAWVQTQLEAVGYDVNRHFYTYRGQSRNSMYVTKIGTIFPDRMYIVSAHLDGRGGGGGADDDASGCSLVLEIARVLASPDVTTDISVRLVFWNNEETGLQGSSAYVNDRASQQGQEDPPGSGNFPEPTWLGVIQHDMILFDHGLPPQSNQIPNADADIEYQASSEFASQSASLANALLNGNSRCATVYPAEVSNDMSNTDSVPFQNRCPSVSLRENRRRAEIGSGANPHWHQPTDVFTTYSESDYLFGFNILQTTLGTVAELIDLKVVE